MECSFFESVEILCEKFENIKYEMQSFANKSEDFQIIFADQRNFLVYLQVLSLASRDVAPAKA